MSAPELDLGAERASQLNQEIQGRRSTWHHPDRTRGLVFVGLIAMAAIGAQGSSSYRADQKEVKGDLAKLQGTWEAKLGPRQDITVVMEIDGHHAVSTLKTPDGKEVTVRSEIRLNEQANPKELDWLDSTGPDGQKSSAQLAIYKLDDDTLTICNGVSVRPTEFKGGKDGNPALKIYKRKDVDKSKKRAKGAEGGKAGVSSVFPCPRRGAGPLLRPSPASHRGCLFAPDPSSGPIRC